GELDDQPAGDEPVAQKYCAARANGNQRRWSRNQVEYRARQMRMISIEKRFAALSAGSDQCRQIQQVTAPAQQAREVQQFEQGHSPLHPAGGSSGDVTATGHGGSAGSSVLRSCQSLMG